MSNELGKAIGKVRHTFSTKNAKDETVQTTITFDFSTSSDTDVKNWLVSNRVIALQRVLRPLTVDEIKEMDGQTVLAADAGKKVKSRQERIDEYVAVGIPEALAAVAVDNPAKFAEIMASFNTTEDDDESDEGNENDES